MRTSVRRLGAFVVIAGGVMANAACGGGNSASQLVKAPEYNPKDQTKCGITKSQARPLIVEWPSSDRLQLETKIRSGLVAVRYVGCEMVVLDRCSVRGKYGYFSGTRKTDTVVMTDADDLYANLPVGAARLEGKLQRSGRLTVNMNLVGRYEAERATIRADELAGDCVGATHFVYGVTVGAFDFYAGADAKVGGSASIGGLGAGGHSAAERETLTRDGDVGACEKATSQDKAPPDGCGALLRLEVVALSSAASAGSPAGEGAPAAAVAGFGTGLGALTVVPSVDALPDQPGTAANINDVDVALLKKLQEAKRSDKSSTASASDKAASWEAVARHPGTNPLKEQAEKRRAEWTQVAEAEARKRDQVAKVCTQYSADSAKLEQLVALDDDVVPPKQKDAYRRELGQVYTPWLAALESSCAPFIEAKRVTVEKRRLADAAVRDAADRNASVSMAGERSTASDTSTASTTDWRSISRWSGVAALAAGAAGAVIVVSANTTISSHCAGKVCDQDGVDAAKAGKVGAWTLNIGAALGVALLGVSFLLPEGSKKAAAVSSWRLVLTGQSPGRASF